MKKILFSILVMVLIIGCSTTEQLAMKSLYSITSSQKDDIRGSLNMDSLLVFKKIGMSYNDAVTLDKLKQNDTINYAITVHYLGPDWRYMDEILLKINDTLLTLKDNSPSRSVNRGSNVTVSERVICVLNEAQIQELKNATSITLQYYRDPVQIPEAGLSAIKAFIE